MSLVPDEELKRSAGLNLAPMVDFLFLVLAVFATMAVTRAALFDTEIDLIKLKAEDEEAIVPSYNQTYVVNLTVSADGRYKWLTEFNEYLLENSLSIQKELHRQQQQGLLPPEKEQIKVLLHVDKDAKWEPIVQAIFSIREGGFQVNPVYEALD